MKILIVLSRFPYPLDKGDKLRAFYQIKSLSQKHEIFLFCLNDQKRISNESFDVIKQYCKQVEVVDVSVFSIFINLIKAFISGLPFQSGYFYSKKAKNAIIKLINSVQPDRVFCQMIRTTEYLIGVPVPSTLDYQDALSKGVERRIVGANVFLRFILKMELKRLLKYEALVFEKFNNKTIISLTDRDFIPHKDNSQIKVIRNGVDMDYFTPKKNSTKQYSLLFTGNMGYSPNVEAACFLANEILPLVQLKIPSANLLISGTRPSPQVTQLQNDSVTVSGWVDDMRDSYDNAYCFVAPMLSGSGLQNKLLEAMAMKLPCITTSLANNALGATHGKQILVADNANDIANEIIQLIEDAQKAENIAQQGYEFVIGNYNWESINFLLEEIICS